jgi:hypothetical protein
MISLARIKRGNSANLEIECVDRNDQIITDLDVTTEIHYQVKKREKQAAADIAKTKGAGIAINTPATGWVTVTLDPADTALAVGMYYHALQLEYAGGEEYEVRIFIEGVETERLEIQQDIIS